MSSNPTLFSSWETVSNVERTLTWGVTVRDRSELNPNGVGQISQDVKKIFVSSTAGPFRITSNDSNDIVWKSGSNQKIANLVDSLYRKIIKAGTHKASSIKVAEAAKVIENTQRDINIAFINELTKISSKNDGDIISSIFATHPKTKDRMKASKGYINSSSANIINRDVFLNAIDGMIYGNNSQHGIVKNNNLANIVPTLFIIIIKL